MTDFETLARDFNEEFGAFSLTFLPSDDPYTPAWDVCLVSGTREDYDLASTGWAGYTAEETLAFAAAELRAALDLPEETVV